MRKIEATPRQAYNPLMRNPFKILSIYAANKQNWEDLCQQCGMCCYERVFYPDGSVSVDITAPCEFLDEETRLCTVYESRHEVCSDCRKVDLRQALSRKTLPPTCAYRQLFE